MGNTVTHKMASSEVTEVLGYSEEIVSDDMIEINNDSLDMPVECVQEVVTDSNFHFGDHQIIYGDELIVSSEDVPQSEEIVGSDSDPYVGLYVPVPASNSDVLDSTNLRNRKLKEKLSETLIWRVSVMARYDSTGHGNRSRSASRCGPAGRMTMTEKTASLRWGRRCPRMRRILTTLSTYRQEDPSWWNSGT